MNAATQQPASLAQSHQPREFAVSVKREGKTAETTVWADTWFDAWSDALDEHGLGCRIEVKAL